MKPIFTFLFVIFSLSIFAQQTEGIIQYQEVIQNPRAEELRERLQSRGIKADIPDENIQNMTLYFTKDETIYKKIEDNQTEKYDGPNIGNGTRIRFFGRGGSKNGYYRNLTDSTTLQEKEIMGKDFLISDKQQLYDWKVTGRKEKVGEFLVLEATSMVKEDTVQVWFTPQIQVSAGPAEFGSLPGLILRVVVNNGERVISATSFDLRPLTEEEKIEKPTKGEIVTEEEFIEISKQKIQELKEMYGEERAKRMMD